MRPPRPHLMLGVLLRSGAGAVLRRARRVDVGARLARRTARVRADALRRPVRHGASATMMKFLFDGVEML